MFSALRQFDAYPKLHDDLKVKTIGGAAVSICAAVCIFFLFVSELGLYLRTETVDHLYVDTSRGEKLRINFDVEFPAIPCSLLSVDAMDVSGSHQLDVSHHIIKKSQDKNGNPVGKEVKHELKRVENSTKPDPTKQPGYCGGCYGAEERPGQCCNSCEEVKAAYRSKGWALANLDHIEQCVAIGETGHEMVEELERGDGCRTAGYLEVNKVAGNFHFAPGKSFQHAHMHIHDLAAFAATRFNVSHKIHRLSFGEDFPGIINPLDNVVRSLPEGETSGMFMSYVKIVPTSYVYLRGEALNTNQFSVTEHFRPIQQREGQGLPGLFVFYELSPIMVKFTEQRQSFSHFLTQLCAILGGVFTVAGIIDRIVFSSMRHIEKKMSLNKLG